MRQIFTGLEYLHTCGITHKDLKPDNILVTSADPLTVKLTDFGLSELANRHDLMIAAAGTPVYVSPELIKKQGYTSLTDVWACGVILYQMVAHKLPFRGVNNQQTLKAILHQEPNFDLPEFDTVSASCKSFIVKCLEKDPAKRMTVSEALDHEFLTDNTAVSADGSSVFFMDPDCDR